MLERSGQQPVRLDLYSLSVGVEALDRDPGGPRDDLLHLGDTQAAFGRLVLFVAGLDDHRIDQDPVPVVGVVFVV